MTNKKRTLEELELAAHNRLKGTICFHVSSALSQLSVIENKLNDYHKGITNPIESIQVNILIETVAHLQRATKSFQTTVYSKLDIGNSPSSIRNRQARKRWQYPRGAYK